MRLGHRAVLALALTLVTLPLLCAGARAGTWTLLSCRLPDGRPAPIDGWTTAVYAGQPVSGDSDTCASGGAMSATSAAYVFGQPNGSGPEWVFTAPAGSTIVGGNVNARLRAPDGVSWVGTPGDQYNDANIIVGCVYSGPCGSTGAAGVFPITHTGGTHIFAPALCLNFGQPNGCPAQASPSAVNAEIDIYSAAVELSDPGLPTGQDFTGPLLEGRAHGVADLLFTASDPSGPGVFAVTVSIDHRPAYDGTPDTNGGSCVPVGTDPADGALMFDHIQPCRPSETVDTAVDTGALVDGSHDLQVGVRDGAGNASTVLDRTIVTQNGTVSPLPRRRGEVRTRLEVRWRWNGRRTWIDAITTTGLPRRGRITVHCVGRGCPRLRHTIASTRQAPAVWRALVGRRFAAGDRLLVTIAGAGRRPERLELVIRNGRIPRGRLL